MLVRLRLTDIPYLADAEPWALAPGPGRAKVEEDLLDLVDATLWYITTQAEGQRDPERWRNKVAELDHLLRAGGSAWSVRPDHMGLERRINDTVATAARQVIHTAPEVASAHLAKAWGAVYGRHPNPNEAYGEAVKAVESIARPLVLPNKKDGSLGEVLGHLRANAAKWRFALVTKTDEGSIDPLVAIMGRLWEGHRARHSGGDTTRDQTEEEAEAAVHLAILLVQWFSMPALRKS